MKFLVDNNLSPVLAEILRTAGTPIANLPAVAEDLEAGAIVVLTDDWVRIRRLPMLGQTDH